MAAKGDSRALDRRVAALAERQHGVVGGAQLAALGVSRNRIATRVAAGRLHRLHRSVYAVGHRLVGGKGRWMAAVLAVGDGAALSHRSAASLWDLVSGDGRHPDVLVARHVRRLPHVNVHRVRSLPVDHVTTEAGVPVTSVARTLVDLAAVAAPRTLERAVGQAEVLRLYDRRAIEAILAAYPRRPGCRALRGLLGRHDLATSLARSPLEERLVALCDEVGLPRPELNVPVTLPHGTEIVIDAIWRRARLAVEIDGHRYHSTPSALERDRRRDAELTLAGLRPVRLSSGDLTGDTARTVELLRGLLTTSP